MATVEIKNPLEQYVLDALNKFGFSKLSEEDQKTFFTQFMAEAERRIGIAVMPLLNEQSAKEFSRLLEKETTPDEWFQFWNEKVPNFMDVVKNTMDKFAEEVSASFNL